MSELSVKRVVITGAATGIGLALGKEFHQRGFEVIGIDINPQVESVWSKSLVVDVSDEEKIKEAAQMIIHKYGRPSHWVNNAGIVKMGAFTEVRSEDFDRVMRVNLFGVIYGTRAAHLAMKDPQVGTIINMSSMSGLMSAPFMSSYTTSKHAVVGFTRALELEARQMKTGMHYVLVMPGFVDTAIMNPQGGISFPEKLKFMVDNVQYTAQQIVEGVLAGNTEIIPTTNGKMMYLMHRVSPSLAMKSSKLLTAKNLKQMIGLEPVDFNKNS